ncbi:class I adenylate-forming enzyme family protein [Pararhodobacter sp. SW119]|uniref:class I adenylate-forming enzyme family protein n=1 Tax=Pararhodobacter sp. SW119 TaxID=2780075 RepID=UPI001ADF9580|nr:class I adenylate-forming enzyme family protein [Pararhodobacter sp. SW119]
MLSVTDPAPFAPPPAPFNLAEYVLGAGAATPDKIALQVLRLTGAERWSYARLTAAVRGIGTGFLRAGLVPGDRLLLRLGNTVDFPLAYLGAIAVGVVPVPTSSQLTGAEITGMAALLDPAAVVAGAGIALPDHPARVIAAADLAAWQALPPCDWDRGAPDRLAYMVFTSGTSGRARAVMHAHRAVWARRMMWAGWYGLRAEDRLMHAGAFNWTYTLGTGLMDPWAIGATALIPDAGIEPAQLPLLMKRFDATIFAAAPGVYRQLLKMPVPALPRLRHGLSAGEKMPETTRATWQEATGTEIYEALGMSEVSTYVSASPERPAPPGVAGYPQPGRRVAVLGPEGNPVPRGTPGEMAVGADDPGLMLGYWRAEAETTARMRGGWFLTGDTVAMDDDGAIRYLGRDDDMLNAGGFRVSPLEVERAFDAHPGISESAAVELPVRAGVSVIALFYVPAAGPLEDAALAAHGAELLARYKQPRLFVARDTLPKGANNKLNRRALRDAWKEGA